MENNKLLIIIPAYNEEESIQGVFDGLDRYGIYDYADILVIDDASTDRTAEIAGLNGAHCISFAYNMGYGNALQAGYKFATVHGYDYIVQMDADGQHDACNVETIYKTLINNREKTDIVLACRFMPGSGEYKRGLFLRLGYFWFRVLTKILGGKGYMDSTTGLQGLDRKAFSYYAAYGHFDPTHPDANMILKMRLLGFRIKQIPAVMHHRMHGKGMHAGIIAPVKYMIRSTASVFAVWFRIRVLKENA